MLERAVQKRKSNGDDHGLDYLQLRVNYLHSVTLLYIALGASLAYRRLRDMVRERKVGRKSGKFPQPASTSLTTVSNPLVAKSML